jgi:hypothetical protein
MNIIYQAEFIADDCLRCPDCDGIIDVSEKNMPCIECGKEYNKE